VSTLLSFQKHINAICQSTSFHLRALRHIRNIVSEETAKTVACSMVQGRLDYCNSLLHLSPSANLHKLQRIQNSLARIVTGKHRHEHITPVLARLHWLPVKYRVHFKLAVITFNALTRQQPSYLAELLSVHVPRRDLRSGNYQRLLIPRNKLKFTDRAFSHAAPTIWNGRPTSVTSSSTLEHFKQSLRTKLYNRAFDCN